ncbi:MAG: heavy metal translocating P-type ATPase [Sulfurovaceae bacterium]|nr:heavy metal translocating P-type ATPase [Sulfurovaceae bacterium]
MAKVKCTHCNLIFDESAMIIEEVNGDICYFCCHGCQGVYHLLRNEGLDTFYAKLGGATLTPPTNVPRDDLERFDLDGFRKKYVKIHHDGSNEINLIIEGIHCSACVWLNEKVLHKTDGIIEATINYTNNKAKIIWDNETIGLSQIIQTIRSIGYDAFPYDPALQEERATKTRRDYYARILVAVFGMMNIMWIAVAQYAGYFTGIEQRFKDILNVAEFVLATPVLFYSGSVFFRGAYYGYKNRIVNMDTLVATGATLAYIYSIYAMISKHGEVYFDSVVMIITFVLVGKYLEVLSKKHAVDTLDLLTSTIPTEVMVVHNGIKSLVAVENIAIGDIIEVRAGEKIVIDGIITDGAGSFDESSLTGESIPLYKQEGDAILSGSICLDSVIRYRATKDASNSLLHSIVTLLEESVTKKPKIEQLANSISGYFSVVILTIAIATFIGWYLYDNNFEKALIISISVIVIACPCALGLATPMSTLVGISVAAKRGILFKEATFLENMAKSTMVAIDKTGTITEGKPSVVNAITHQEFDYNLLYSLVISSNHPISQGIKIFLEEQNNNLHELKLKEMQTLQAKGIMAKYDTHSIAGGNDAFMKELGIKTTLSSKHSLFFFAIDGVLVASFELSDKLRIGAKEALLTLKSLGLKVVMLTGDHALSANAIAKEAGIDNVYHSLLPQDKAKLIDDFHAKGERVIMVGDGINDSIALAKADIAIAMGSGADIAINVSDVVLLDEKPQKIAEAYRISKRTYQAIKENLSFSIVYNIIAVPLAVMGFVYPLVSALSMSLSSLIVVGNSIRIKRIKFNKGNKNE